MSIIYEALKKVEASQSNAGKSLDLTVPKERFQVKTGVRLYLLVFLLIAGLAFLAGNSFFGFLTRAKEAASLLPGALQVAANTVAPQPQPAAPSAAATEPASLVSGALQPPTVAKEEPNPSLVLNGIFFSDGEGYALINNQIAKEGDVIEGAKVKRISPDEVELENAGLKVRLATVR